MSPNDMSKKVTYITTPIYYVNARPHIGHAYTTIAADVYARFCRVQKKETFLLTGTDEHGLKIQKSAQEAGKEPQKFVDEMAQNFKDLWKKLNISNDNFIQTTSKKHKEAVQKALQTLYDTGSVYKGTYAGLYCVGCEQFKNESDLVEGRCADHNTAPEKIEEESYLLKMSDVAGKITEEILEDRFCVKPKRYKKEILSFLENNELRDIAISRKNVSWGIPLPFDREHTTYVWADAFLNYLTGLAWDGDARKLPVQWPPEAHLIGKDILRVHATIWPAILLHLHIPLPKMLFVHGHLLSGGKKMSKTLGNVITIEEMLEKFGVDGSRYLLLSAGMFGNDVDVTMERMTEKYNANLANGLGNLTSRVLTLAQNITYHTPNTKQITEYQVSMAKLIENFEMNKALEKVWVIVDKANKFIDEQKPWELKKTDEKKFSEVMERLLQDLYFISELLVPFLPETAERMKKALKTRKSNILFERVK